jgi:DNA primase
MITPESVDKIRFEADIVAVVSRYVELKKVGANYRGLSPFTDEKTPSFYVSPQKQIYKCFSSGKGGDAISFITEKQSCTFVEAIREIADICSISIEEETPTKEVQQIIDEREQLFSINKAAAHHYTSYLLGRAKSNAGRKDFEKRGYSDDTIIEWGLGLAPDQWRFLTDKILPAGHFERAAVLDLVRTKNENNFDFFKNRIMFSIRDHQGRVCGFAGRVIGKEKKGEAKYINSSETPLFAKSKILYGLDHAITALRSHREVILVEGYTDVISLHEAGLFNTVGTCGTSLTIDQAKLLKRYADTVTVLFDGDSAGQKATDRAIKTLLEAGFVSVMACSLEEGQDPDSLIRSGTNASVYIKEHSVVAIDYIASKHLEGVDDPIKRDQAFKQVADVLSVMENPVIQEGYRRNLAKKYNITQTVFRDLIVQASKNNVKITAKRDNSADIARNDYSLPKGCDFEDVKDDIYYYRFFIFEHIIYMVRKAKDSDKSYCQPISNFSINPICLVRSKDDPRRLVEITNVKKEKELVDIPTKAFSSNALFTDYIEGVGNFQWDGFPQDIKRVRSKLYDNMPNVAELRYLGHQKDGFWAWANGAVYEGRFIPIDKHGLIKIGEKVFLIDAYSPTNIANADEFEDQRKFSYVQNSTVTLKEWSELFCEVHGTNGQVAFCFYMASLYRDIIFRYFKFFPLLFAFGISGAGKSTLGWSLRYMFFSDIHRMFNLNTGTKVAFQKEFSDFINSISWFDEYHNGIEPDRVQGLKGAFDGTGHIKSVKDSLAKTTSMPINSACYISGQKLPIQDVALFKRTILLDFNTTSFTKSAVVSFHALEKMQKNGLTHITSKLAGFRSQIEREFLETFDVVLEQLDTALNMDNAEDRILRNFAVILAVYKIMDNEISDQLPLSYDQMFETALEKVRSQMDHVASSAETYDFWNIIEHLLDHKPIPLISHGDDFVIKYVNEVKLYNDQVIKFDVTTPVMYVRMNRIIPLYKEYFKRINDIKTAPMDKGSLLYYLEHSTEYLGKVNKFHFNHTNTSAVVFNYLILQNKQINLERDLSDAGSEEKSIQMPNTASIFDEKKSSPF